MMKSEPKRWTLDAVRRAWNDGYLAGVLVAGVGNGVTALCRGGYTARAIRWWDWVVVGVMIAGLVYLSVRRYRYPRDQ
jgi:hypothetical protein